MPTEEENLGLGASVPTTKPTQQELQQSTNLLNAIDTNNADTQIYDGDTPYILGKGYRFKGIDTPEMSDAIALKTERLKKAKEAKVGRFVSLATAGERAKLEAQLLEVEDKSINPLAGLGGQQVSFDDTQATPQIVDLGRENLLGYDRAPELDASGKRIVVDNTGFQEELVRRGYAVPYDQSNTSLNDLFAQAQEKGAGLFNPQSGDIQGIGETAQKRSADLTQDSFNRLTEEQLLEGVSEEDIKKYGREGILEVKQLAADTEDSSWVDALQSGTAQLVGKAYEGAGELLEWASNEGLEATERDRERVRRIYGEEEAGRVGSISDAVYKKAKEAGKYLSDLGEFRKKYANEFYGYNDAGGKMSKEIWGNLKEGKVIDALDGVSAEGALGIIAQSLPEMAAYFNPVTLSATFAGNVAEAKKEAEEVKGGGKISNGRMAAIILGEGISMGLERFAIDKAININQLNAKAAEIAQNFAKVVPGERLRAATLYALNKTKNIGVAAGAEGFQEVVQEGQRILTTQLGEKDIATEENLDSLGQGLVGGTVAGGGIRTAVEAATGAKDLVDPKTAKALGGVINEGVEGIQKGIEAVERKVAKEGGSKTKQVAKGLEESIKNVDPVAIKGQAAKALASERDVILAKLQSMDENSREYKTWANTLQRKEKELNDKILEFKRALADKKADKEDIVNEFGSSEDALIEFAREQTEFELDEVASTLGASPEALTKARAIQESTKTLSEVQDEVIGGERGYTKYYKALIAGLASGDQKAINYGTDNLIRFGKLQGTKSSLITNGIDKVRRRLERLPEAELRALAGRARKDSSKLKVETGGKPIYVNYNDVAANMVYGSENGAFKIAKASGDAANAMQRLLEVEEVDTTVDDFFPEELRPERAPTEAETAQTTDDAPREVKVAPEPARPISEPVQEADINIDEETETEVDFGDIPQEVIVEDDTALTPEQIDKPTVAKVKEVINNRVIRGKEYTKEEQQLIANAADDGILTKANQELAAEARAELQRRESSRKEEEESKVKEPISTVDETLKSIDAIDEEITKYYNKLNNIKSKYESINNRIATHKAEIDRLNTKKDKAKKLLTDAKDKDTLPPGFRAKFKRIIDSLYNSIARFNKLITDQYARIDNYKQVKRELIVSKNKIFKQIREFESIKRELQKDISGTDLVKKTVDESHGANTANSKVKVNPKQRNSAFQEINLQKIISLSKASSILGAVDLRSNEVTKEVRDFARKAYLGMKRSIMPIQGTREDFYHRDSLGRGLLFDSKGEINANTATAIALSASEYVAFNRKTLANNDIFSVGRMIGKQPEQVSKKELEFFKEKGILKKLAADTIGKDTLAKLGIRSKKDIPEEVYSKLVSDIGQMGLFYLENQGLIDPLNSKELNVPIAEYAKIVKDSEEGIISREATVPFIKLSGRGYDQAGKLVGDLDDINTALGVEGNTRGVRFSKNKLDVIYDVKKNVVMDPPKKSQATLNKLANEEYALDFEGLDAIARNGIDKIMKIMGFKTDAELDEMAYVARESAIAKNREITASIDALGDLNRTVDKKGNGFYFNWFFSRNGRFFLDSNTVNPQTDKLHRFLITPKSNTVEVDVENEESFNTFRLAIAQAFGVGIDKVSNETAYDIADGILKTPVKDLEGIFDNPKGYTLPNGTHIEIEEVGHTLQALGAIKAYRARKSGKFVTNISFELDAVTSGFIIKLMQLPVLADVSHWLAKGGVFTSDYSNYNTVEGTNKEIEDGLVDSYRTLAGTTAGANLTPKEDPFKLWSELKKFVPEIVDENGNVTKDGRNLFKYPFMTFNYGAKINSIKTSLAYDMLEDIPQLLLDGKAEGLKKKLADMGVDVSDIGLRERDIMNSKIKGTDVTVGEALRELLKTTYGDAVGQTFDQLFKPLTRANEIINDSFRTMFRLYDVVYQDRLAQFKNENSRLPSAEEKIEIFRELVNIFPGIKAPFSEGTFDSVAVVDTKTATGDSRYNNSQTYRRDGSSTSVAHIVREFEEAIAAGGVVPIHYIDGSMIGDVLDQGGILGVHDAILPNLNNARKANEQYNDNMYEMNKDYSVTQEIVDSLNRVIAEVGQDVVNRAEGIERKSTPDQIKKGYPKTYKLDANSILKEADRMNSVVQEGRKRLFGKDMKIDHMTGMNATIEKKVESPLANQLKDKVNTKTYKDIMAVMKKYKECRNGMS